MKKTALILALAILSGCLLASCGESGSPSAPASTEASPQQIAETEPETETVSGLAAEVTPEIKAELGLDGYDFKIYLRDASGIWANKDITAEALDGEAFNDAVYVRNQYLQETYGFTISSYNSPDGNMSDLSKLLLAGDDTYDAVFPQARAAATCAQQGLFYDLNKLRWLDLGGGSWNSMFNDTLSVMGRTFYATGDISTNLYDAVRAVIFNKGLARTYQLDSPYELVDGGKWTLDALESMAKTAAADINGDSKMDVSDQWGMAWQSSISGVVFYYGSGEQVVDLDDNKIPYYSLGGERSVKVFDRISRMMSDKNSFILMSDDDGKTTFKDGRSLFFTEVILTLTILRDSETDFGIIPLPKFDETQPEYIQFADGWCISPACVPVSAKNPELSGYVLQAMAEANVREVIPAYYDICLTGKYIRDDESAKMLDIVFKNCVLDNSDIFQWAGLDSAFKTAFTKETSLEALAEKYRSKMEAAIEKTLAAIEENT